MTSLNRTRLAGVGLIVLSATAWSLNGLYTRYLTTDLWTTLAGRGIATASFLLVMLIVLRRGAALRVLIENIRIGWLVILAGSATMVLFVAALFNTTVANVTVIYAVSPLMAAGLAWYVLRERLVARTGVAFLFALAGIVIIVGGSIGTERLIGDMLALLMSASFAVVIVEMRRKPRIDNVSASLVTSILVAVLLSPLAAFSQIGWLDAVLLTLFGLTSNVLGFFLFIAGVRRIPPAQAGLIATLEVILAPYWVWLLFSENPGATALIGGSVVLGAVLFDLASGLGSRSGAAAEQAAP